jgi:hypothetical protein
MKAITSPADVRPHGQLVSNRTQNHRSGTGHAVLPDEPAAPKLRATLMPCCVAVGMSCLGRRLHRDGEERAPFSFF